jgi:PBP1b-binding outer membrane lipoprotein LpoB
MKKITIVPMIAVLALGLAACTKPVATENVTDIQSNTVVEESDANLSAVDGIETSNSTDLENSVDSNSSGNAL